MSGSCVSSNNPQSLALTCDAVAATLPPSTELHLAATAQDTESVDLEGHTGADGQRVVVDTILGLRLPLTDAEKADEQ